VHYRAVPSTDVDRLLTRCRDVLDGFRPQIRVNDGPKSLEAVADLGWTKGTAVQMILKHLCMDGALAFYAGDGANDAEAMEEVSRRHGLAVGVGPDAPAAAQYHLHGPAELQSLLEELDAFLALSPQNDAQAARNALAAYGLWTPLFPGGSF